MNGIITGVGDEQVSRNGGKYFYLFLKLEDGTSARTHIVPDYRNYSRWEKVIAEYKANPDKKIMLEGLTLMRKGMVDADSKVVVSAIIN